MPRGPMGRGHGPATEKAKDFKGTIKKLFAYLYIVLKILK